MTDKTTGAGTEQERDVLTDAGPPDGEEFSHDVTSAPPAVIKQPEDKVQTDIPPPSTASPPAEEPADPLQPEYGAGAAESAPAPAASNDYAPVPQAAQNDAGAALSQPAAVHLKTKDESGPSDPLPAADTRPPGAYSTPDTGPSSCASQTAGHAYAADGSKAFGTTPAGAPPPASIPQNDYGSQAGLPAGAPAQAAGNQSATLPLAGTNRTDTNPAGYNPNRYNSNGYNAGGYNAGGYNPNGYQPGAWQLPPQVLAQAAAQVKPKKRGKPGGAWDRFSKGCQKLWKQLISSLVVRIVCNGAVSAFAGFVAAAIIRAVLTLGSIMTFLFFIAFTLLIFIKMTNHTMSYIKNIAEAVGKISGGDYSVKVPEKYSDELGTLAAQINQMTVELSRAREREQLEEQRKNEFITSIAHDLRTPLTSVIGYLGLISEQDGQPVDRETLVRYADVAFRKSKRLEQLISQLFDFSRYNFGEIHPAENRIDLAELLEQIHQEFYPQFTERQLQSRVIISGRPVMVKGDGNMLVRVFDNILGNAVRYGANGRYIDIELYNRGTEAVVRATNYGAEISPEDLSRIFDKFYRTDASRSSETGGAGLGMAIAKNIVEAHGGRIQALSGDGKVTFEVVLPVIAP